jgi:hypothetical protein
MSNFYERATDRAASCQLMPYSRSAGIAALQPSPTGRRGAMERADYFIDRFRVGYQFGGGWMCGCADFATSEACRHTREAAGRLAAQIKITERIRDGSLQAIESGK